MIAGALTTDQLAELLAQYLAQHQIGPWSATLQHMVLWSPGLLILLGIFYLVRQLIKFLEPFLAAFIAAQQAQAAGSQQTATAIGRLDESLVHMPQRHDLKFDEILIGQQMILSQLDKIDNQCRQRSRTTNDPCEIPRAKEGRP